ncbi:MAG: sugar phosphate isomerase/epimerase, partial [Acidobacteria bacterium]|nr:sugar phosphate isomerase/epimerase [Acidobacteriota bacterium]
DRPLDEAIEAMVEVGFSECELWMGHVEPQGKRGKAGAEELRKWRMETPLSHFKEIGDKVRAAGIELFAYNYSFRDTMTDEEINRGFEMTKALGAKNITASATVSVAKRVAPFADKYKIYVGMHGHSNIKDPNEFAKPESFEKAMDYSKFIGINLDVGHFWAAGYDPVAYIEKQHARIIAIHLKDRKKDQGPNMPLGEGDTPLKECLQLMKAKKYKFPANIEYEYKGTDTMAEVKKCYAYCRKCLE